MPPRMAGLVCLIDPPSAHYTRLLCRPWVLIQRQQPIPTQGGCRRYQTASENPQPVKKRVHAYQQHAVEHRYIYGEHGEQAGT
jgi:hypothetical protein